MDKSKTNIINFLKKQRILQSDIKTVKAIFNYVSIKKDGEKNNLTIILTL